MISAKGQFKVWVSKIEGKGNYSLISASTSKRDKKAEAWVYSNWYIRLIGDAHKKDSALYEKYVAGETNAKGYLVKKFPIIITSFSISNEAYEKDGQKVWDNFQMVAWDWEFDTESSSEKEDKKSPFDD